MRSIELLRWAEALRDADPEAYDVLVPTEIAQRLGALSCLWPGDYASPTHQVILMTHLNYMIDRARSMVVRHVAGALE